MKRVSAALVCSPLAVALVSAVAIGPSCTTFSDVTASAADDAGDDVTADEGGSGGGAYLGVDDAARVCALVFKCPFLAASVIQSSAIPLDPLNFSLCAHWLASPVPPDRVGYKVQSDTMKCLARAGTCTGAGACLSIENFGPGDPRCPDAGPDASGERCIDDGGTVLRCAGGYALHCGSAFYGPQSACLQGDDGSHWCATSTGCKIQNECLGTLLDYCGAGSNLRSEINCAFDGYTCNVPKNSDAGIPDCITGTVYKPCQAPGTSCAGDVVDVCDGAYQSEFDCAALGGTCSAKDGPARCVRASDACSPFDAAVNACDGTTVSLCIGGQKTRFDCASVSLGCVPASGSTSGHCG